MKDFYMTLLSNSSMDFHPQNKTSSFTVQLPRYMRLDGDWEVGLAEIQYPYTFYTVSEGHNDIHLEITDVTEAFTKWVAANPKKLISEGKFPTSTIKCKISQGYYSDVVDIISAVNDSISKATKVSKVFEYDSKTRTAKASNTDVKLNGKFIQTCTLSERLGIQLGFPPRVDVFSVKRSPYVTNIKFGVPDKMIIYCDIVEPQIFGDSFSRVLTSVNTLPEGEAFFAKTISTYFNVPQYIPVQTRNFEAITIDIRDIEAKAMSFQYGTLSVKLHFRKLLSNC